MANYAANTTVDSDRSIAEMRKILTRYGANKSAYDLDELQATIAFELQGRRIKFVTPLPDPRSSDFTHTPSTRVRRSDTAVQQAYEQAIRQRFRALALLVKAKLEAIELGTATFESEMLNKTLLPNGMTVEEWIEPQGKMPLLRFLARLGG